MTRIIATILIVAAVSGCSRLADSRLNPGNWFGGDETVSADTPVAIPPIVPTNARRVETVDNRALMQSVSRMEVQNVSGGVLVTVDGQSSRAGAFNVQLVETARDSGTLTLAFRVQYPATVTSPNGQPVTASEFFSNKEMRGIRRVVVQAANGSLSRSIR